MRDCAVVLTYPGHFLLTRLTLFSIKEFFPEIKNIVVLVDDFAAAPLYVRDCKEAYQTKVIPLSRYNFLQPFAHNSWHRQQMVKLHLDLIVDNTHIFFADGDIGFTSHIPFSATPHAFIDSSLNSDIRSKSQDLYINELLGVDSLKNWDHLQTNRFCTSVTAFRDINTSNLTTLRQFVENRHALDFIEYHKRIIQNPAYTMSEWELLETYRANILNEKINWLFCPPRSYADYFEPIDPGHPCPYFYTCYGTDADFTQEWWDRISTKIGKQNTPFVLTR
jgi:hypothetical protein